MEQDAVDSASIRLFVQGMSEEDEEICSITDCTYSYLTLCKRAVLISGFRVALRPSEDSDETLASDIDSVKVVPTRKLHWDILDEERAMGSLFTRKNSYSEILPQKIMAYEVHEIQDLFGLQNPIATPKHVNNDLAVVRLLDPKRSRNVSIALAQFKEFDNYGVVANAVSNFDLAQLPLQKLEALADALPLDYEARRLQQYRLKRGENLDEPEKFMLALSRCPNVRDKVMAMIFAETLQLKYLDLTTGITLIERASLEAMGSKRLARLLEIILAIGNVLNTGTLMANASGFSLRSLATVGASTAVLCRIF